MVTIGLSGNTQFSFVSVGSETIYKMQFQNIQNITMRWSALLIGSQKNSKKGMIDFLKVQRSKAS